MSGAELVHCSIRAGVWSAELAVPGMAEAPPIDICHLGRAVGEVAVGAASASGRWPVSFAIPPDLICDGVQTFVLRRRDTDTSIGHFTIVAGDALDDDLRDEIELLRAELDLLKRAFRRHCAGGPE